MSKLISICIPTYNQAHFIGQTLESLLNQTYANIEILIGDNVSTDNTKEIVNQYCVQDNRIKYFLNEKNLGYSLNCNNLIKQAKGEYIAIFHSDDVYAPSIIEEELNLLLKNPTLAGAFTFYQPINEKNDLLPAKKNRFEKQNKPYFIINLEGYFSEMLLYDNYVLICPTSMIKKSVYLELNGYNPNVKYIEDSDMWIRILEKYSLGIVNKRLINYRQHAGQGSQETICNTELSNHLQNLQNYFNQHPYFKEKYQLLLERSKAKEFLTGAENALKSSNSQEYRNYCLTKSREFYKFSLFENNKLCREWFIQNYSSLLSQIFFKLRAILR